MDDFFVRRNLARELRLIGAERLDDAEARVLCNGIGAAWMPPGWREMLNSLHPELVVVADIHDIEYAAGGGPAARRRADWNFLKNGWRVARHRKSVLTAAAAIRFFLALRLGGAAAFYASALTAPLLAAGLCGCFSATQSTVSEFDSAGNLTRQTVTGESVVRSLVQSTQGKTVIVWESGWAAYAAVSAATVDDPTPHGKIFAGKTDRGMISALPAQQNWEGIAQTVASTRQDLTLSAGSSGIGVSSTGK